jgi:hypothetical protein
MGETCSTNEKVLFLYKTSVKKIQKGRNHTRILAGKDNIEKDLEAIECGIAN